MSIDQVDTLVSSDWQLPRLGDAGTRAILELVGKNDRVKRSAEKPAFEEEAPAEDQETVAAAAETEATTEVEPATDEDQ